jgi:transcription elongation GreA/GreB family factor
MSVAFTREDSAETASEIDLPDRPISSFANLVTAAGLAQLAAALEDARARYAAAHSIEDINERRRSTAPALRDVRYYAKRLESAGVVASPSAPDTVGFGVDVTFVRDDGRRQTFRIVGEDEADPRNGSMSYVAPVARALHGKQVGDIVTLGEQELEIVAIA